jgi:hypothetical protein
MFSSPVTISDLMKIFDLSEQTTSKSLKKRSHEPEPPGYSQALNVEVKNRVFIHDAGSDQRGHAVTRGKSRQGL